MKKLRVLLLTRECLRTDSNEGNVLFSLFEEQPMELANIYCKPGLPDTALCSAYFQLTDRMALDYLLHKTPMGKQVCPQAVKAEPEASGEQENRAFYDFFRRHNLTIFHCGRELLWKLADFRSPALKRFVQDFAPDVIFAPMCYCRFVLAVHRYVIALTGAPAVSYLYDDLYSLKQFRFSPLYWCNRFAQRAAIRKTLPYYRFAYTMTQQQAEEYGKMLSIPLRVLLKCAPALSVPAENPPHPGVRLLYAGGVYYGRDRTLSQVACAVRSLRAEGRNVSLDVYTSSPLSKKATKALNDGEGCHVHPPVPFSTLQQLYHNSDVALHVESFQKKNAWVTRLSFSTKIVDCLASGGAVLAICPAINAGWQYLRDEDAAVCVSNPEDINAAVRKLVCNPSLRQDYSQRALICLQRNHSAAVIRQALREDLADLGACAGAATR